MNSLNFNSLQPILHMLTQRCTLNVSLRLFNTSLLVSLVCYITHRTSIKRQHGRTPTKAWDLSVFSLLSRDIWPICFPTLQCETTPVTICHFMLTEALQRRRVQLFPTPMSFARTNGVCRNASSDISGK